MWGLVDNVDVLSNGGTARGASETASNVDIFDKIDDIRSLKSVAELTTLITHAPSDYSYFNLDRLKLTNLPRHLKKVADHLRLHDEAGGGQQAAAPLQRHERNRREAPRIDFSNNLDRMKYFKVTKKAIYLCDRTIEKRSEKPCRLETERQFDYNAKELFQPYYKAVSAKIFTDVESVENFLMNDEVALNGSQHHHLIAGGRPDDDDDDDPNMMGAIEDNFEIPGTAHTNEPFFSQHGGEFMQSQQLEHGLLQPPMDGGELMPPPQMPDGFMRFDDGNLIEAPMQVNAISIEYAKTSKNIDVRRLKQQIWNLLTQNVDKVKILTTGWGQR